MNENLKLICASYSGSYNDTHLFNALINKDDKFINIGIEKHFNDMRIPDTTWNIVSDSSLLMKEKEEIIKIISNDTPEIMLGSEYKIYDKEIKCVITEERRQEIFNYLMDYVFEHCSDDKETYRALTHIIGLNDEEIEELGIVFDEQEDELDMEI